MGVAAFTESLRLDRGDGREVALGRDDHGRIYAYPVLPPVAGDCVERMGIGSVWCVESLVKTAALAAAGGGPSMSQGDARGLAALVVIAQAETTCASRERD